MKALHYGGFFTLVLFSLMLLVTDARPKSGVLLEGLYATSVALDYEKNGPHNCFDGSIKTSWKSMPGAGPDEGIMLYFEAPVRIGSMIIRQTAEGVSVIRQVRIYADGIDMGTRAAASSISLNRQIRSLYIRIDDIEGIVKTAGGGKEKVSYGSGKSAGIAEIELYDESGAGMEILPPKVVKGGIIPSSTLAPVEAYHKDYLFDSRKESGWVEGAKGTGKGESLRLRFDKEVTIRKIKIWNGLLMSKRHFTANERVKTFSFGPTGEKGDAYPVTDSMEPQVIELRKGLSGKDFTFMIDDVFAGTSYKDTVIGELRFFDGSRWFLLHSGYNEELKKKLLARTKGTVLEGVMDKMYGMNYSNGPDGSKQNAIVLRSNGSFVIYARSEDFDGGGSDEATVVSNDVVMDGFWEIKNLTPAGARIEVLGKKSRIMRKFAPYRGDTTDEYVSIFSDILNIDGAAIRGTKHLGTIER